MISAPTSVIGILLLFGGTYGDSVTQPEGHITLPEGARLTLDCSYQTSGAPYLFWYIQYPNEALKLLLKETSGKDQEKDNNGFWATKIKEKSFFHLEKTSVQMGDAAVYYCVLSDRGSGGDILTFGAGTKLTVKANIKDPQPALYQLTSPKSSDTSVCLLTDFDSSNTYTNGNDSTVLEMMTMESKSYGAVAWGSKSSFNCTNAFPQNIINLTQPSGSTCKVQDVEQSFETDKDLNLMNASLIFLRVIFLKTVGFNLLMTLRLWSN